jgi:hypothetical protein
LDVFRRFTPIPILLDSDRGYDFSLSELRREIAGRGLGALLLSNPCNPTGKTISGAELASWVATARELDCTLLLDEFYSHFVWRPGPGEPGPLVSAARWVEDVDRDPVVLFDGLTKNWRYPDGWYDCGKTETLLETNRELLERPGAQLGKQDWPSAVIIPPVAIAPTAVIEHSIVGPHASIAARAVVRDAVVRNSIVNEDAVVEKILLEGSVIGENALVSGNFRHLNVGDSSEVRMG